MVIIVTLESAPKKKTVALRIVKNNVSIIKLFPFGSIKANNDTVKLTVVNEIMA